MHLAPLHFPGSDVMVNPHLERCPTLGLAWPKLEDTWRPKAGLGGIRGLHRSSDKGHP